MAKKPFRRGGIIMVRRTFAFLFAIAVGTLPAGCMTTSQFMNARSQSAKTDVFSEIGAKETIPKGYASLEIKATIKTHAEGFYLFESKHSLHGKKGYPFVLNIDGQAVVWKDDGEEETLPIHREKGGRDPDGGTGVRYRIDKKIRMAGGHHRVFFGLPGECYYRDIDVALEEGKSYSLALEPIYKRGNVRHLQERKFINGIEEYKTTLQEGSL
ncbi:MAG: hypothetical protein ACYC37_04290 [Desulfobacteria bacterium]